MWFESKCCAEGYYARFGGVNISDAFLMQEGDSSV